MAKKHQLKDSEFNLKPKELQKIIYAASSLRDRCILKTLAQTGIRRAELAALDIRDLDFDKKRLRIVEGKGAKERIVPISSELASDLQLLIDKRKTGPVFVSRLGDYLSPRTVNDIVAQAGLEASIENPNPRYASLNPHIFRHSFARIWKAKGGSIESLSKILGHSSVATTLDLYGTESIEDVQENYERLIDEMFG